MEQLQNKYKEYIKWVDDNGHMRSDLGEERKQEVKDNFGLFMQWIVDGDLTWFRK